MTKQVLSYIFSLECKLKCLGVGGGEGERYLLTEENKMSRLAEYVIKLKRINAA